MGEIEAFNIDTGEIEIFSPSKYIELLDNKKYRVISTPWDMDAYYNDVENDLEVMDGSHDF